MTFTTRLFLLVALGAVPLFASAAFPPIAVLAIVWNLVVAVLAVVDYLRCPRVRDALQVERIAADALSVAAPNTVTLNVRNLTQDTLRFTIRDEPPVAFLRAEATTGVRQKAMQLAAFDGQTLAYSVTPPARGDFEFGDIFVRMVAPMGLVVRQEVIAAARPVRVFPNLRAIEEYTLMMRRSQVTRQGARKLRVGGGGREFASLRDYAPDDEYRTIDWKATARRGKVTSKTFQAERSQDVLLLIDVGRLMRQEIAHTQKLDHVVNSALMLAHVVAEADDRIGLLTFADEPREWIAPRRGKSAVGGILNALYAARALPVESDYRAAFQFLATRWRKRSLAVLFTDLADPESSALLLEEIAQLVRSHKVVCVVVSDPLVLEKARQIPARAADAYEKAVAEEVIADRARALALLSRRGALVVDAPPEELSLELIDRYITAKSRALV